MPVVVFLDRVDTLSVVERNGVIRSLVRKARISIPPELNPRDFSILKQALDVCPAPYTTLISLGYDSLVLVERNAEIVDGDSGWVDVLLKYEHILDGPNQGLENPPTGRIYGKGRCSISEKTTNFYYPYGDYTLPRQQILTSHTFPEWDNGIAGMPLNPSLPLTVIQGGEVSIPFPQANFTIQGIIRTYSPVAIAFAFVGKINDALWMNGPAYTWICSEVQWEVIDTQLVGNQPGQITYKFQFEFQYNVDTWNPTVAFNDQRTGRPPADVMPANIKNGYGVLNLNQNRYGDNLFSIQSIQVAAREAATVAAQQVITAAYNGAVNALRAGDTIEGASRFASAAALNEALQIIADSREEFDGFDPVLTGVPGAVEGQTFGNQAAVQVTPGMINTIIASLDLLFPFPPLDPTVGGDAIRNISPLLMSAAIQAGNAAGAKAGADVAKRLEQVKLQPAGIWTVPALQPVNFDVQFGSYFEGLSAKVF